MDKMSQEEIEQPSPDGTTPLMQLIAQAAVHKNNIAPLDQLLVEMTEKGKLKAWQIMETSIIFDNTTVFKTFFGNGCAEEEAGTRLAKTAIQCESVDILKIIWAKFPGVGVNKELAETCQTIAMQKALGFPIVQTVSSELLEMSAKFPKFNEGIENTVKPLPEDARLVDIKTQIMPLLKDKFCTLKCFKANPKSMPICDWRSTPCQGDHNM